MWRGFRLSPSGHLETLQGAIYKFKPHHHRRFERILIIPEFVAGTESCYVITLATRVRTTSDRQINLQPTRAIITPDREVELHVPRV